MKKPSNNGTKKPGKSSKLSGKNVDKPLNHKSGLKKVKIPRISEIKAKGNSRRDSIKDLNRYYSKLLLEHKKNSEQLINELLRLIGDQYKLHIRQKHSTRILQACLKYGNEEQRQYIYENVKAEIPDLCMTSHGSHLAIKIYRYCNSISKKYFEDNIINSQSSITYIKSRYGSLIWDFIYNRFTTTKQTATLIRLLTPNSIKLFNPELFESLTKAKNLNQLYNKIKAETDLYAKLKPVCLNLFGKLIDKSLTNTLISHDIGYLSCLFSNEDELIDFAERFTQGLDSLYLTKSGVYVASCLYGYIPAKGRKMIVKQLKLNLEGMCTNSVTNLFVSRVLLLTDDTKLTVEHIIKPLSALINTLSFDKYGHKIIFSISNKEPLALYTGYEREVIQLPSPKSLKEFKLRHSQLYEASHPLLLNVLSQNNELDIWVTNSYSSLVVESCLCTFNLEFFKKILNAVKDSFNETLGLLDNNTCLHLLQRIIKKIPNEFKEVACEYVWNIVKVKVKLVLISRSVFLLVTILESVDKSSDLYRQILGSITPCDITESKSKDKSNCGLEILEKLLVN